MVGLAWMVIVVDLETVAVETCVVEVAGKIAVVADGEIVAVETAAVETAAEVTVAEETVAGGTVAGGTVAGGTVAVETVAGGIVVKMVAVLMRADQVMTTMEKQPLHVVYHLWFGC